MPISGRNLREVSTEFAGHLTRLFAKTITSKPLIPTSVEPSGIYISFRNHGEVAAAPIRTVYGPMDLYVGQLCDAVEDENTGRVSLRTIEYIYTVRPAKMQEPLFRWEYVRFPEPNADGELPEWCKHHLQGDIAVDLIDH